MSDTTPELDAGTIEQIDGANATGLTPVVFSHGLWLLPSSWDRWATDSLVRPDSALAADLHNLVIPRSAQLFMDPGAVTRVIERAARSTD